jgi:3-hydroxyacyl-[acyl-carrier-protein] dehydratase
LSELPVAPLPIPHAEPFRFVSEVQHLDSTGGRFSWSIPRDGETFALRMFPQLLCVEAMAQAAAAFSGLQGGSESGGESGTLASVDKLRFAGRVVPGEVLTTEVCVRKRFGALVLLFATVKVGDRTVAEGELVVKREQMP